MDENNTIARTEVVVNGPSNGESGLVGEVDGDADLTAGEGGWSGSGGGGNGPGGRSGGGGGGWMVDLDGWEMRVIGIEWGLLRIHCNGNSVMRTRKCW